MRGRLEQLEAATLQQKCYLGNQGLVVDGLADLLGDGSSLRITLELHVEAQRLETIALLGIQPHHTVELQAFY